MATATTFLGWYTIINLGIYSLTAIALTLFRSKIKGIHAKLTSVPIEQLDELYFSYLANFKLAIIFLSLSPYLALKIMGG
ncbi:hypothetical protein EY643_07760 [Halioglobus maricola]|uniref:DUF6868 domain-containing protein n=1 Tax=Halioglobus maricola TaxID=2601894 RepID=A0A5P9NPR4_9GAMM|nr:hypothetical protein EY643_07760 [Halioglobus maricola]